MANRWGRLGGAVRAAPRLALLAIALLVTACTAAGPAEPASSPMISSPRITPSVIADGRPTISCTRAIDVLAAPPADWVVVAGVVAVPDPATALQANPSGGAELPMRFFAKSGLVVRADAVVELRVPTDSADRLRIGWGSPGPAPGVELHFPGCPDRSGWLAFAGGYHVAEPACLPLDIRSGGREEQARIGIGIACRTGG